MTLDLTINLISLLQLLFLIGRLGRLQDNNVVLSYFNEYSENCYVEVLVHFSRNTNRALRSMKTYLDYVFLKLRTMKSRILAVYPYAFLNDSERKALHRRPDLETP
ncbi:kxDL motif-containing protein LO9-177-like [Humulus lupulus]|uniref:kxDL motif-containing protein LO9-177-like n=1 Tax=Humulus lupulus TaxID=3486 RepID=UPI002B415968|nr:kxDL motif-containing protein LO9-177-like [Humulus lupulus]